MTLEALAADSGESFDIDSGVADIGKSLFGVTKDEPEETPQNEIVEETGEQSPEVEEESAGEEAEKSPDEVSEEKSEETPVRAAPQSWKKDMHEAWSALDPSVQDYIEQRENQMKEGLEKDRGDANLGRMMRDVMAPYSQMLQQVNVDEPTMVRNLMNAHYRLSTAPPEQKQQLFTQLAQNYGIKFDGEQATEVDPVIQQLQNELQTLKSTLNQRDQATLQEARKRVEEEVTAFAAEHPLFDEVSEDIVAFINAGMSLEDAYDKAIWANPVTRKKEVERLSQEKEKELREKAKKEAAKAKKATSVNVRSRDTAKAPTGPVGTMEDTLRETYREIQQRS